MKKTILLLLPLLLAGVSAKAQTRYAFWDFAPDATVEAHTFPGTPTFSSTGSLHTFSTSPASVPFTAFNGTTYTDTTSRSWNPGSTGNSFTLALNMTNLENLQMRFDYRGTASVGFSAFSGIDYSLNGTDYFSAITAPTMTMNSGFQVLTTSQLDFSAVSAIENQSSVLVRFTMPDIPASNSFRIDNLQVQATVIPEPGTLALVGLALGSLLLFRRRK